MTLWEYKIMTFVTVVNRNHSKETVLLTAPEEMMPQ